MPTRNTTARSHWKPRRNRSNASRAYCNGRYFGLGGYFSMAFRTISSSLPSILVASLFFSLAGDPPPYRGTGAGVSQVDDQGAFGIRHSDNPRTVAAPSRRITLALGF